MSFFTGIQRVSILRPWQQARLKTQHLCLHSCEYVGIMKCSDPSPCCLKGNHIFSVSCWYTSGCGTQEVSWWSQTAQLPLLPVPVRSRQQHWRDLGEHHGLPDWLYGEAAYSWSNQHQKVPPQPQAEVCRGCVGTGRGAIHVVRTARLRPLRPCKRWQLPTPLHLPSLKILLQLRH